MHAWRLHVESVHFSLKTLVKHATLLHVDCRMVKRSLGIHSSYHGAHIWIWMMDASCFSCSLGAVAPTIVHH